MTLEQLLKTAARRSGIPYETIPKDYAIGHVLAALAAERSIAETLVMKGGTGVVTSTTSGASSRRRPSRLTGAPSGESWRRSARCEPSRMGASGDFFPEALINVVRQKWDDDLGALVADLPRIEDVLPVLEAEVAELLGEV